MHAIFFVAVTIDPVRVADAVGANVTLTCNASGGVSITYKWMRNGIKAIKSQEHSLVIHNITLSDSGEYRCTASSGNVSVNSEYATVMVWG